jgi:hypothetical protein
MKNKRPIYTLYRGIKRGKTKMSYGLCMALFDAGHDYSMFRSIMKPYETSNDQHWLYWGSGYRNPRYGELTPLRENLLLLWACYNGEEI